MIQTCLLIVNSTSAQSLFVDSTKIDHFTFVTTEPSHEPTTYDISLNKKITSPKLSARSRPPGEIPGSDGDFNWIFVVAAVVVAVVIVLVLVFVFCFLSKRRRKK